MFQGSKGGSSSFKQTPDNLRSNDTFEGVLGLCVGPIKGPKRGLKSIKLDDTAIENETNEMNFADFTANFGDGDPFKYPQKIALRLGAGASPVSVGSSLRNTNGSSPVWITRTLNNTGADFVDLRFVAQQMFNQTKKGVFPITATIEIQMKPTGTTTWINPTVGTPTSVYDEEGLEGLDRVRQLIPRNVFDANGAWKPVAANYAITGKTTSAAVYELRIGLPNDGAYAGVQWDIRCRLLERETYEADPLAEKRTISWESMAAVYSSTMGDTEGWRGLAWLQLYGLASDQLNGVPEVTGEYDTKIVSVPASAIYNPTTRQYAAGVWDGSWAKAFTNDPAWVINDAITDSLSGLSLIAQGSYLNKWDALDASKWFSTLVPDGTGGTEPRYSLNLAISEPQRAEELIRYMAGAVGALVWDQGNGEWRMKVDKPEAASDIFTLDNIEGQFVYSHTDIDTRYNDIIGQFKNAEMDYRQDAVRLYDNVSIAKLGRKPTNIPLIGCTNRQEAMRRVKLRIRAAANENKIVTFTTNRRGRNVEPLSTILIADGDMGDSGIRAQGRIISIASDRKSIVVRDPLRLEVGVDYLLNFAVPNPNYTPETTTQPTTANWDKPTVASSRNVVNTAGQRGTVTTIYLDTALPTSLDLNANVSLAANGLASLPRMFRVTAVVPDDDGERVSISAINIDVDKWSSADNVSKEDTIFQDLRGAVPAPTPVTGQPLLSLVTTQIEQGRQVNLRAAWVRPAGAFIAGFQVQYSINGGAMQPPVIQQTTDWELVGPVGGTYKVEIRTRDRTGALSLPLVGSIEVNQQVITAPDIKYNGGETIESLKPRTPGATDGMNADERVLLNQLTSDTAAALAAAEAAEALIQTIEGSIVADFADLEAAIDTLNQDLASVDSSIAGLQSATSAVQGSVAVLNSDINDVEADISDIQGSLSDVLSDIGNIDLVVDSLSSRVSTYGGSITSLQSVTSAQGGTIATLQSNLNTANANITQNASAITTINGSLSSLSSSVSSQGASITSLQQTSSTQAGNLATLTTRLDAGNRPNLIPNGGFENYMSGWTPNRTGWATSISGSWGQVAGNTSLGDLGGATDAHIDSSLISIFLVVHTLSFEVALFATDPAAHCYGEILWYNSGQNYISTSFGPQLPPGDFSGDNTRRKLLTYTVTPPSNAVYARVRVTAARASGSISYFGVREVKLEIGATATPFNSAASVVQQWQAYNNLTTSFASMETRVSSAEGSVTSLLSSMTSANGSLSSLSTSVNSLNGSVSTLQQSASTQAGQISSLQNTVATQGGLISSNALAIATAEGSLSTLNTIVSASSSPNLVPNSGFENGLRGWGGVGVAANSWTRSVWAWGNYAISSGFTGAAGQNYASYQSPEFACAPGPNAHTQSFDYDLVGGTGVSCFGEIVWLDNNRNYISLTASPFSGPKGFDQSGNTRVKHTHTAPTGAVFCRHRTVFYAPNGVAITSMAFRQVKVELGSVATPYSGEASATQMYQAYSDLDNSHSSLTTTVNSQGGSISTLFSTTSTTNGTVSILSSRVDAQGGTIDSLSSVQSTQTGQIATLSSKITLGGNLLQNTEYGTDVSEWGFYSHDGNNAGFSWGRDLAGDAWRPTGEHNVGIHQTDGLNNRLSQWYSAHVSVTGNLWYEASVYASTHRCYSDLRIEWYKANGDFISTSQSPRMDAFPGFYHTNGGRTIGSWTRMWVKAQAPALASRAILNWLKYGTSQDGTWSGATDSYGWMCRPQLAEVYAETASPTAYLPGRVGVLINNQAVATASLTTQQASLTSTVATQGAQINSQALAVSTLQGDQASLSSTVGIQGANIASLQTATSTTQGNVATLNTQVTAGSPNLLRNGGFELGNINYWVATGSALSVNTSPGVWGTYAATNADMPDGTFHFLDSNSVSVERDWHTLTADVGYTISGAGGAYLELLWYNSAGNYISTSFGAYRSGTFNFSADGSGRRFMKITVFPPEGVASAVARITWQKINGTVSSRAVRQVKLERGQVATPYSSEATSAISFQALNTLNTQYASLSSTVATQGVSVSNTLTAISTLNGNVATLFGRAAVKVDVNGLASGWETNNNGSFSDFRINADHFSIEKPGGGARTEFSNGNWRVYDASGVLRVRLGVW